MIGRLCQYTSIRRLCANLGEIGCGAGKSGGSGGSVRTAGGAFGKLGAAREEEYFYRLQDEQLKMLKQQLLKRPNIAKQLTERERLIAAATEQRKKLSKGVEIE